jgi:hypothetical protein
MTGAVHVVWPIASITLRTAAFLGIALLLIFVLLPAAIGAAGPPVLIAG